MTPQEKKRVVIWTVIIGLVILVLLFLRRSSANNVVIQQDGNGDFSMPGISPITLPPIGSVPGINRGNNLNACSFCQAGYFRQTTIEKQAPAPAPVTIINQIVNKVAAAIAPSRGYSMSFNAAPAAPAPQYLPFAWGR